MCDMKSIDKEEYRRLLDEIGEDYCHKGTYCIFKEFLVEAHPSRRLLYQLKAMDKAKYIWSKDTGIDVGWDVTMRRWVDEGWALKFAQSYADHKRFRDVFTELFGDGTI